MKTRLHLSFLVLMALLASCRSEQTAFQFRSTPPLLALLDTVAASPVLQPTLPAPEVRPSRMTQHFVLVKQHSETQHIARSKPQPRQIVTPVLSRPNVMQLATPQQAFSNGGSFLQILGTGFAVGGIVLGFVVGGWAGFGVFALCALVGLLLAFWGSFIIDGELP